MVYVLIVKNRGGQEFVLACEIDGYTELQNAAQAAEPSVLTWDVADNGIGNNLVAESASGSRYYHIINLIEL